MSTITMPAPVAPADNYDELIAELTILLRRWHIRAFGKPTSPIVDPLQLLTKLRSRVIITRDQYLVVKRLFLEADSLKLGDNVRLIDFLNDARRQVSAEYRRVSDHEQASIDLWLNRGMEPNKLAKRFGIPVRSLEPVKPRDARQTEEWVGGNSVKAGASCR